VTAMHRWMVLFLVTVSRDNKVLLLLKFMKILQVLQLCKIIPKYTDTPQLHVFIRQKVYIFLEKSMTHFLKAIKKESLSSKTHNPPKTVFQRLSWRSFSSLISSSCARYGPLRRRAEESSSVAIRDLMNPATRSTVQSTGPTSSRL